MNLFDTLLRERLHVSSVWPFPTTQSLQGPSYQFLQASNEIVGKFSVLRFQWGAPSVVCGDLICNLNKLNFIVLIVGLFFWTWSNIIPVLCLTTHLENHCMCECADTLVTNVHVMWSNAFLTRTLPPDSVEVVGVHASMLFNSILLYICSFGQIGYIWQ